MTVYMLGFIGGALGSSRHSACTYLGFCEEGRLDERLAEHRAGRGAAITRAAVEKGLKLELLASIPGDRALERRLKNMKNSRKALAWMQRQIVLCPCCRNNVIRVADKRCWLCAAGEAADALAKDESDRVATV